jgi:arsenite efflux pump ACR3 and related permeases (arsenite efflux pump ACR3 or related permease)
MPAVGNAVGRLTRQDAESRLALAFSGTTRNSLVVLPLALALPDALAPIVVVTQTLVELLVMVVYVRLLPRLIRDP